MGDVIRNIDFQRKKELSGESIRREIGDLRVVNQEENEETGEVIDVTEKIEARKVAEYLKKEIIESGDTEKRIEKKLKEEHGVKNNELPKRKKIMALLARVVFGKKSQNNNYQTMKNNEIARARRKKEMEAAAIIAYEEEQQKKAA